MSHPHPGPVPPPIELRYQLSKEGQRLCALHGLPAQKAQVACVFPSANPEGRGVYAATLALASFEPDGRPYVVVEGEHCGPNGPMDAGTLLIRVAQLQADREQAAAEQREWINEHGSAHLRRCAAEGIEHGRLYRNERLAAERAGWEWADGVDLDEPRNPPEEALRWLDAARGTAPWCGDPVRAWEAVPEAVLRHYRRVVGRGVPFDCYTAAATFLGRAIYLPMPAVRKGET